MSDTTQGILKSISKQQFVLRTADRFFQSGKNEILVHPSLVQKFKLVDGALVMGQTETSKGKNRLTSIDSICGMSPEDFKKRPDYADMTAIDPCERFDLGSNGQESMRIVDLIAPIGKGSRQLIVSPPRAGKTVLLEQNCEHSQRHPDCSRLVLRGYRARPRIFKRQSSQLAHL